MVLLKMWLCGLQRTSRGSYKETNEQTRLHESGGIPNMLLCLRLQDTQQCGLANASSSRKLLLLTAPEPVRTEKARRFNKLKRLKKKKPDAEKKMERNSHLPQSRSGQQVGNWLGSRGENTFGELGIQHCREPLLKFFLGG